MKKNCNDYGIKSVGGAGTEITGVKVSGGKLTRNAADTNSTGLMYTDYSDDLVVSDIILEDGRQAGLYIKNAERPLVDGLTVYKFGISGNAGLTLNTCAGATVANTVIDGGGVSNGIDLQGLTLLASGVANLTNIVVKDIVCTNRIRGLFVQTSPSVNLANIRVSNLTGGTDAIKTIGIEVSSGDMCVLSNISIDDVDNQTTAADSYGIEIKPDDTSITSLVVTGCSGTGVEIAATADLTMISGGRTTLNGTNYNDGGTNTSISSFDIT